MDLFLIKSCVDSARAYNPNLKLLRLDVVHHVCTSVLRLFARFVRRMPVRGLKESSAKCSSLLLGRLIDSVAVFFNIARALQWNVFPYICASSSCLSFPLCRPLLVRFTQAYTMCFSTAA